MKTTPLKFVKLNIRWLIAGILTVVLGYIVLGWDTAGAKMFDETSFAWHKLTIAPIILVLGYTFVGLSLMLRTKN